ncbi:MAG: Eco57I restriction-modification methylase domain-containing protein [Halobacteriota archaeon]
MNPANIVDTLIKDIKERLTLDGKNRVFNEGEKLRSEFMNEEAEPEAFTREFLIDKIFSAFELEKLSEKKIEDSRGLRSVDYRIKSKSNRFLVEAKPLNADLEKGKDSGVKQIKGLFKLAEVKENYDFGVATNGLRWVFIDRTGKIADDLRLEADFAQIKEFLVGKEKVVSPKTEEEISKKFYDWYNALLHGGRYKNHENKQKTVAEDDCLVSNIVGVKDLEEREQIAQVVMNRLIFIKFLQSKGIIGEDILRYLAETKEDMLTPKLRQLFFGTLDRPVDDRFDIDERFKDIPYLNGSLFVHTEVERKNIDYKVRAEILKEVIAFLDSFKFVHKEQFENENSIDPEILGYIFERAMTATDRKGTGAYYTPKPITKYISENTIYPHIIDRTNEFLKTERGYKEGDLLTDIKELFLLAETTLNAIWNDVILKIRVLDNACGSGAFLLAAANIMFELNRRINDKLGWGNSDVALKKLILINNLHGVDINPNGVEIAKLRLWLWLVDSYEPERIEPLPNIDYNLRVGNSLIGYVDISELSKTTLTLEDYLWDEEKDTLGTLLKQRSDLIRRYKRAAGEEAKELKGNVQELDVKISNLLNVNLYREFREKKIKISKEEFLKLNPFHWGFEFYEAFDQEKPKEERGFDVVIGNPPYVRQEKISASKPLLSPYYSCYNGIADLYVYFYERGISTINENGFLGYISSNKWMKAKYGGKMRMFMKNMTIKSIIDFYELPVFDVSTEPAIVIVKKQKSQDDIKYLLLDDLPRIDLSELFKSESMRFGKEYLDDSGWNFSEEKVVKIIEQMYDDSIPLKEYTEDKLFRGITTGLNEAFIIDEKTKNELIKKNPKSAEIIKPYLKGTDIHRYYMKFDKLYFLATGYDLDILDEYPAVFNHLLNFKDRLEKRYDKGVSWYNLRACAYYQEFDKTKIVYLHTAVEHGFYLDTEGHYLNNSSYVISVDDKYLLCFLNSELFKFYKINTFVAFGDAKGRGRCKLDYNKMQKVPIQKVQESQKGVFKNLADYMLFLNETEERRKNEEELIEFIDKQVIDSLVYELYFKEKFEEEGLKTNILGLVEPYLKDVAGLKTDEEKPKVIKEVVEKIKMDGKVMREIERMKGDEWVRVVEGKDERGY